MAEKQYQIDGVYLNETDTRQYQVETVYVEETVSSSTPVVLQILLAHGLYVGSQA